MAREILCDNYDCPVCMQCLRFSMDDATTRFIPSDDMVCEHFQPRQNKLKKDENNP